MAREYFVIDGDGFTSSMHDEAGEPEAFASLKAATKRARELAQSEPGRTVVVAQAHSYVTCRVSEPNIVQRKL